MKTYVIATALIVSGDKYLIGKRSASKKSAPGRWEFISGFIEEKEPAEETILREIKEELNANGKIIKCGGPYWGLVKDERWIVIPFLVEVKGKVSINPEDHSELKWVDFKELNSYPEIKEDISSLMKAGLLHS